jgi:hypothetical protein
MFPSSSIIYHPSSAILTGRPGRSGRKVRREGSGVRSKTLDVRRKTADGSASSRAVRGLRTAVGQHRRRTSDGRRQTAAQTHARSSVVGGRSSVTPLQFHPTWPRITQTTDGPIQRRAQSLHSSIILHLSSVLRALCAFVVKSFLPDLPYLPVSLPLVSLCLCGESLFSAAPVL